MARPSVMIAPLACFALACASPTNPEGWTPISGVIVARDVSISFARGGPTIHVKEPFEDECGVIFAIAPETAIRRRLEDGSIEEAGVGDLRKGQFVQAWVSNHIILASCPGQAGADSVTILSG